MSHTENSPDSPGKTARRIAADVLAAFQPNRPSAAKALNDLMRATSQKQRATDLVFGTIRNLNSLDLLIERFGKCPVARIRPALLSIIRIAAFELACAPSTPQYSIVNEAVENAKALAGRKQTGFVNAVLRQITRHIADRQAPLQNASPTRTIPQSTLTGCEFDTDILPDPDSAPAEHLAAAFSLPRWLIAGWIEEFGVVRTRDICFGSNRRPGIYIHANTLKITAEQLAETLRLADVRFDTVPGRPVIRLKSAGDVTRLPGFSEGLFIVQDTTASEAVRLLDPQPGWNILDLCAAPGTKTMQLARATRDEARIFATDIDADRLNLVRNNMARLGVTAVELVRYDDLERTVQSAGPFDAVLLDVPCSNTGVLAKRVEARHRLNPQTIDRLAETQRMLIEKAAQWIKPRARICYTTCSIQKQENSLVVRDFLREHPGAELESESLVLPSAADFDHDGGYAALIRAE